MIAKRGFGIDKSDTQKCDEVVDENGEREDDGSDDNVDARQLEDLPELEEHESPLLDKGKK